MIMCLEYDLMQLSLFLNALPASLRLGGKITQTPIFL
jgi:hypothetical protein